MVWPKLIAWAGLYFYNEEVAEHVSGSGDTLFDMYHFIIALILALGIAIFWIILDRKRRSYNTLLYWQATFLRYYLCYYLLVYGLVKVIKLQFSHPMLSMLLLPLGNKSPMGLAWTFMGASDTYTIFSGVCEVLAGCFLLYRKTRTLGGIMAFGVMLNVFLMNMSYDIPVKIFSFNLMVLGLFFVLLDSKRLINVFILNKPSESLPNQHPFKKKWANISIQVLKGILIILVFTSMISDNLERQKNYGDASPKPAMYGIYEMNDFVMNNDTLAPSVLDSVRWRYLVLEKGNGAKIFHMNSKSYLDLEHYTTEVDTNAHEITLLKYKDSIPRAILNYEKLDSTHYAFEGFYRNKQDIKDSIKLKTTRTDESDFLLMNRGFHWVNEYPYNR
ncbi:hypothetical protein [Pustulibacterium marinum]|nr:hypothetical protein [Pustulibacterium marinum]